MEIGDFVISRGDRSGVFAGRLEARNGSEVTLSSARRIWYWDGAASLSELSQKGVSKPQNCKFPAPVPEVLQLDCIELLPLSEDAQKTIAGVPVWSSH